MDKDGYYYYVLGEENRQNGRFDLAVGYYLTSIRLEKHFKTYERLYECYSKLHQTELAHYFLELAYEENPNNDKTAFLYALCMVGENRADRAKEILLSILGRNPDYKKARIEYERIVENEKESIIDAGLCRS